MKPPRISVNSVMIVVFAAAVDCMAMRSIGIRPEILMGLPRLILLGTLPMANILAVVLAHLAWRRDQTRPFRHGFVVVGSLAVLVTIVGLEPFLVYVTRHLYSTAFEQWLQASPIPSMAFAYCLVPALLFLFQLLAAVAGGSLMRNLAADPKEVIAYDPSRRRQHAALLTLLILLATPAVVTEGLLRWKVDAKMSRHHVGMNAVIDIAVMDGWRVPFQDGSSILLPNGAKVRVVNDSQPTNFSAIGTTRGSQLGDFRNVLVTLLDGARAGESTSVPRQCLRSIR